MTLQSRSPYGPPVPAPIVQCYKNLLLKLKFIAPFAATTFLLLFCSFPIQQFSI